GAGSPSTRPSTPDVETPSSSAGSTSPTSPKADDPFDLEQTGGFTPPGDGRPRLDDTLDDLDEGPVRLFEWTPERAAAVVKAGGYVLHTADGMTNVPGGERLWKATDEDAQAAGEPLARILNRY